MDVASSVYSLTVGIGNFVSEQKEKDAVIMEIASMVAQIQNIIRPLLLHRISDIPLETLGTLQSTLANVDSHLRSWRESRSRKVWAFVNPWAVTEELREDREQLMNQYVLLMGAVHFIGYIRGYNLLSSSIEPSSSAMGESSEMGSRQLSRNGAEAFWHSYIGGSHEIVKNSFFCHHVSSWLGQKLSSVACKRLLLRIDESNTGYVTLSALKDLVQEGNLRDAIYSYTADPTLPLLVWIDDDIVGNASKVASARKCGVTVVQLASTSAAKAWIDVNRDFLKKHDNGADLRFVSDQVRLDLDAHGHSFKNYSAGNDITEFIRSEGFRAPMLIYTSKKHIHLTQYVNIYPNVGSGTYDTYKAFVSALAKRRKDDISWIGFGGSSQYLIALQ